MTEHPDNSSIQPIDPSDAMVATRIVEIQRAAYAIEAALMDFDGIPTLHETTTEVQAINDLVWRGAFQANRLVALIAWELTASGIDIDRLAVDPSSARQGLGRQLVRQVPTHIDAVVSTGSRNEPAKALYLSEGFTITGETEVAPGIMTTQFGRPARGVSRTCQ